MAKKKARRSQAIPVDETKSARFVRVVTPRVNKAIKSITVIGYCTGSSYEYTSVQVQQIIDTLSDTVNSLIAKFAGKVGGEGSFTLKK